MKTKIFLILSFVALLAISCNHESPITRWTEKNGIVYSSVSGINTERTSEQWIKHLHSSKGSEIIWTQEREIFYSIKCQGTYDDTINIAIIKDSCFSSDKRTASKIQAYADSLGFVKPNPDIVFVVRDMFTDDDLKQMGLLWVVIMSEPLNGKLLVVNRAYRGCCAEKYPSGLSTYIHDINDPFEEKFGFVFIIPNNKMESLK